jgi:[ribosomal protein S18]-alanine N-acetyltransferase
MDDGKEVKREDGDLAIGIRWLVKADLPNVCAIEMSNFARHWTEEDFLRTLRQPNSCGMVACNRDCRIVGFMVFEFQEKKLRLLNMAVAPTYRLKGVGKRMIAALFNEPEYQHRQAIDLMVDEKHLGGQQFLQACGFKASGVERGYFDDTGDDAYRMRLQRDSAEDLAWQRMVDREPKDRGKS